MHSEKDKEETSRLFPVKRGKRLTKSNKIENLAQKKYIPSPLNTLSPAQQL